MSMDPFEEMNIESSSKVKFNHRSVAHVDM